jgi:cyclophilin family peptidyl-prolyl cis-trans isomerase/HEAT repeat protein
MKTTITRTASAVLFFLVPLVCVSAQPARKELAPNPLISIMRYEDQRNWNDDLKSFLSSADPIVRKRAALAAGRIGDARAIPTLADMVLMDRDTDVRQMAAFALGETELPGGAYALAQVLKGTGSDLADPKVRARAVEALGKIVAAMSSSGAAAPGAAPPPEDERLDLIKAAILDTLRFEESRRSHPDRLTILLALTAVLRSRPEGVGVGPLLAKFLEYSDPEIVATALNTIARLRLKDANERVRELLNHGDPIVRANAARVMGAAEHKEAFDAVLDRALKDPDIRVRASAIRALGTLKDDRAAKSLSDRMYVLMEPYRRGDHYQIPLNAQPQFKSEWLEVITALGNILRGKPRVFASLTPPFGVPKAPARYELTWNGTHVDPEIDAAFAKMNPGYVAQHANPLRDAGRQKATEFFADWRYASSWAQGLAVIATLTEKDNVDGDVAMMKKQAADALRTMIDDKRLSPLALPNLLNAYAAFKPADADGVYLRALENRDVVVRSTAAELLGNQPANETHTRALINALPRALRDRDLNDAALAILDALGKQKNQTANDAIKSALNSDDHLIRRKAVALLKANGVGDFSDRIGLVKTRNTDLDYHRAMARIGKHPTATVVTTKGLFVIEFLPTEAPLNVDNFIQLAKRGYFNGQTIPRVVPNFVVQAGDPRGDQNGGPGYQIRCEINEVPFERAAVGMALSGKDTGGSQWFVTHSPQPHLDGGYTVFGRVIRGMEVVDNIARGDMIRRVVVNER